MKIKSASVGFGLDEEVVRSLARVFEYTPRVEEVIIFGSRAKGNFNEGSDIDLAIKGKTVQFDTVLSLMDKVDELGLLYKIDLQNYQAIADKDVLDHIRRVGKIFWKRNPNSNT